jgi:L-fuculose-phosphate aldolase
MTPTAVSKSEITPDACIETDMTGKVLRGSGKPFSELALHLAAYSARKDCMAVVHAHPPYSCALAVSGGQLNPPFMAEPVVSLGPDIPVVPFSDNMDHVIEGMTRAFLVTDIAILGNHGIIAIGDDPLQAFYRIELVEHMARIKTLALQWGGPTPLSSSTVQTLIDKRAKGALGPQARGIANAIPMKAAEPPGPVRSLQPIAQPAPATEPAGIQEIIAEEIARAISGNQK